MPRCAADDERNWNRIHTKRPEGWRSCLRPMNLQRKKGCHHGKAGTFSLRSSGAGFWVHRGKGPGFCKGRDVSLDLRGETQPNGQTQQTLP